MRRTRPSPGSAEPDRKRRIAAQRAGSNKKAFDAPSPTLLMNRPMGVVSSVLRLLPLLSLRHLVEAAVARGVPKTVAAV